MPYESEAFFLYIYISKLNYMRFFFLFSLLFLVNFTIGQNQYNIIPKPLKTTYHLGSFVVNQNTTIQADEYSFEAKYLQEQIKILTGFKLNITSNITSKNSIQINIRIPDTINFNKEQYNLDVSNKTIYISAFSNSGVFYGIQSLLQMIPFSNSNEINLNAVSIFDAPKFQWRGMHLDVARHFFSLEFIKNYIDYLATYKLNTFHWHLTDDQGWRIEIKKYPKLTEIAAWRSGSMVGHYSDQKFDKLTYGGFYTQEQIKEVVAYATQRHITVVPEIEMPGHAVAALAAYPEFACAVGPFEVAKTWGVLEDVFCPKEETFIFLQDVLTEVIALFPSQYIHIGGDECPKTRWRSCGHCQKLIQENELKDEHELQSYFIQRIEKFVNSKGRKIIGWDEILEGGLAPNAAVMSWRGTEGGIRAAKQKHYAVMTPSSHCYFDHYQADPKNEPLAIGGYTTVEKVYSYNPIPEELSSEEAQYILGAQANVWTEYITSSAHVEYMMMTRMTALSEVLWGTSDPNNYKNFEDRLIHHLAVFKKKGINYSEAIYDIKANVEEKEGILQYTLQSRNNNDIRFTTDDSEPHLNSNKYGKSISISKNQKIRASYFEDNLKKGNGVEQNFTISKSTAKKLTLEFPPSKNFSNGNTFTLLDGIYGDTQKFGKDWLGFSGDDVVATIDFKTIESISNVQFHVYDGQSSWIYLPLAIAIETSLDGVNFEIQESLSEHEIEELKGSINLYFNSVEAKYIKITVKNNGKISEGKPGEGNDSWLFIDEITVN
ncbi:family 20 glycosylhydrolase [uncultured Flavobacterium sp.]|uniref:beta-N-acetylhexosaminidase n=1 Tax=uncultured Flavobacterium sp. TaxID=165435 RepID=UPI0030CA5932